MSGQRRARTPDLRLGVPNLFTEGRFEQVLIMTFGGDLEFYEQVLRRHFGQYRNQIVLLDGQQLDRAVAPVAVAGTLRHLNRSWLAGPIRIRQAAHAKLILLAGPESGVLLVGSGNLHMGGYAGAGECFTPYRWSPDDTSHLTAFTAIRALTDGLEVRGWLDSVTAERLKVFWEAYDWWHGGPVTDGPVRHNLDVPLGEQLMEAVGGETVQELVIAAPFHDRNCAALDRLLSGLKPRRIRVVVQPRQSSVDPKKLAAVLQPFHGEVFSIEPAGDAAGTYLHAKIVLVKTKRRALCLSGSANCSVVALWARYPDANVELGNLAVGGRDAFDYLFDPGVVTLNGPVDPARLGIALQGDTEDEHADQLIGIFDLRWVPPTITGTLHARVDDPTSVAIEVGGRNVRATVTLTHQTAESTRFEARLAELSDIEAVEQVAVVIVRVGGVATAPTVPYQVNRLGEQDRRRVDAERLKYAARLELDDPDLEQALVALEEILIGQNVARWTRGGQSEPTAEDDDAETVSWDDIDWTAVRRHPRFSAYGTLGDLRAVAGSDLANYLDALSRAVRELVDPEAKASPVPKPGGSEDGDEEDDEIDESDVSAGVEGAEIDDVVEHQLDSVPAKRRQSIAARNLRLIRNFVRRNLQALEQPGFRAGAGAGVVIPNIIILNWVCWWVATKDEQRPGELVEERLRLWRLLWGSEDAAGYLDDLDDEERGLVLERFDDQLFDTVTLASMADVWAHVDYNDSAFRELRAVLRSAVTHPCWQVGARHLSQAIRLVNSRPTTSEALDAVGLAEVLWDTACSFLSDREARAAVAVVVGASLKKVVMSEQPVVVDETRRSRPVWEINVDAVLTTADVAQALAAWRGVDDCDYYRLKWNGGVALYSTSQENGWIYVQADDSMSNLGVVVPAHPPWRVELDRLCEAAEQSAEAAA